MFKKQKKLIPVSLLTGYLGAGKTTVLNHVLSNQQGYKVAVIVNDIGEVNIDASLIAKGGAVTQKDENLVPLQNGCICCTLKVDLMKQIVELARSGKFDYILIEASGICEPGPIAGSICMLDGTQPQAGLTSTRRISRTSSFSRSSTAPPSSSTSSTRLPRRRGRTYLRLSRRCSPTRRSSRQPTVRLTSRKSSTPTTST